MFDPHHSPLETDKALLKKYVAELERALDPSQKLGIKVTGILEIGSFANGEAVDGSDIDTRVYVESPSAYIWNVTGHKSSEATYNAHQEKLARFVERYGQKPMVELTWTDFNEPLWDKLEQSLGLRVEFGLVDQRYADFELSNLEHTASNEHSFLMQSNIVYDPRDSLLLNDRNSTVA